MVSRVTTVAFEGIEAIPVDVQVLIAPGKPGFNIVGLPDKAVAESRERVQGALHASGLALPYKRITVNLAPADLPKEGSHYDLPIAVAVMMAMGAVPADAVQDQLILGEVGLDGRVTAVAGVLPAAIGANALGKGLICPAACGAEAAWAGENLPVLAPDSLIALANHFRGTQVLSPPKPALAPAPGELPDLKDIKGQESAKRALEIAPAGGHHMLPLTTWRPQGYPSGSPKQEKGPCRRRTAIFVSQRQSRCEATASADRARRRSRTPRRMVSTWTSGRMTTLGFQPIAAPMSRSAA
jgi:magnesium chelatase family protein